MSARPVQSGMGMALLQKMGWKPGEGLGKNKEGVQTPLQLEVKLDRKGVFLKIRQSAPSGLFETGLLKSGTFHQCCQIPLFRKF